MPSSDSFPYVGCRLFLTILLCSGNWLVYHGFFFFFFFGFCFLTSGAIMSRAFSISSLNAHTACFRNGCSSILLLLNTKVQLFRLNSL